MLERVVDREKTSTLISEVVVATTDLPLDRKITEHCKTLGIRCFTGPEEDVLKRYLITANHEGADTVVRVTSDCPLFDGTVLDQGLKIFQTGKYDYVTNILPPTFPDGLDFSIFKKSLLIDADREATLKSAREHVVPWMWKMCSLEGGTRYSAFNLTTKTDASAHRWTVDHREDLSLVQAVYRHFGDQKFSWEEVLAFLRNNPNLSEANSAITRDEGYLKSLKQDQVEKK